MSLRGTILVSLFLVGCVQSHDDGGVRAVNLSTGETREFADESSVPDGWAVCSDDGTCPAPYACEDLDETACLAREDCDAIYAESRTPPFVGCSTRGVECAADACGPAPGAPAIVCEDGSIGGFTGRCLAGADGTCGWEFRDCPPPPPPGECTEEECGPAPGIPSWICEDGSVGGSTGVCSRGADGACGWEIRDCPPVEPGSCPEDACPGYGHTDPVCPDGTSSVPECERGLDGACGWHFYCPAPCEASECGPAPGADPRCPDSGESADLACERNLEGVCGWHFSCG